MLYVHVSTKQKILEIRTVWAQIVTVCFICINVKVLVGQQEAEGLSWLLSESGDSNLHRLKCHHYVITRASQSRSGSGLKRVWLVYKIFFKCSVSESLKFLHLLKRCIFLECIYDLPKLWDFYPCESINPPNRPPNHSIRITWFNVLTGKGISISING